MRETLLITGGAGFIGSHLADAALAQGHRVIILDNLITGKRENLPPEAVFIEDDLEHAPFEEILADEGVTVVSHHAAQANVRVSLEYPLEDARTNILGSLALFQACRQRGVRRVLFASSGGTVYGEQDVFPCAEDHPKRPQSPYGCAKAAIEEYLLGWQRAGDLDPIVLRYANIYGPRQDPKGEAGIVAIFSECLLKQQAPRIFGDGYQTRDYVFVGDLARLQTAALKNWTPGVYNVGTGIETDLHQLLELLQKEFGASISPRFEPPKMEELRRNCLSPIRLRTAFQLPPTTLLEEGLIKTAPYYRNRLHA